MGAGPERGPGGGEQPPGGITQRMLLGEQRLWMERLLFGEAGSRRFTQDSPVLPDVWIRYGMRHFDKHGDKRRTGDSSDAIDLLLTPYKTAPVGKLGRVLSARLLDYQSTDSWKDWREQVTRDALAYNESSVAVRLYLDELIR